jgi:hypothetical protein
MTTWALNSWYMVATVSESFWSLATNTRVCHAFGTEFTDMRDRFKDPNRVLDRFSKAVESVLANGWSEFHAVEEAQNELCIARDK